MVSNFISLFGFGFGPFLCVDTDNEPLVYFNPQVETCQEKIISLELEDPKSLESPSTPTTEDFIQAQVQQRLQLNSSDDSDDNQSMVTVCANSTEETFVLQPTDPDDFINANVFVKYTPSIIDGRPHSNLQTIVEVVNPMFAGDGTAKEIAIGGANDDGSLPSFDVDVGDDESEEYDGVVYRRELSINDKMKNVLAELKENEKVRLSLSRSMDEDEEDMDDGEEATDASASYEEKTGSIGTVFMVRERLINDFYDHQDPESSANQTFTVDTIDFAGDSQATVYANPGIDEFLANEIRHAQAEGEAVKARKEMLTLDLTQANDEPNEHNDDDDEDTTTPAETPTTPTSSLGANVNGGKKKRKKNKNKKK